MDDNTITVRQMMPDARRIRGLLKSPRAAPATVAQMDEAAAAQLRAGQLPPRSGRKPAA